MPRTNLTYTAQDIKTIFYMKNKGYSYKEIADAVKRSTRAIENFVNKYRPLGEEATLKKAADPENALTAMPSIEDALNEIPDKAPGFVQTESAPVTNEWDSALAEKSVAEKPAEEPVKKVEVKIIVKPLNDYPARELIKNLYDRGYRCKELVQIVERKVLLEDIIGE